MEVLVSRTVWSLLLDVGLTGIVLDVSEVVHEIPEGAWLGKVSSRYACDGSVEQKGIRWLERHE